MVLSHTRHDISQFRQKLVGLSHFILQSFFIFGVNLSFNLKFHLKILAGTCGGFVKIQRVVIYGFQESGKWELMCRLGQEPELGKVRAHMLVRDTFYIGRVH